MQDGRVKLFLVIALLLTSFSVSAQITNWFQRPIYLNSASGRITYGAGKYVATYLPDLTGSVLVSSDGSNWVRQILPTALISNITRIRFINGTFFLLGRPMLFSTDTITWSKSENLNNGATGIAYGNGKYVLVGSSPNISISADALQWSTIVDATNLGLTDVVFGGTKFVAIGSSGLLNSSDGIHWQFAPKQGQFTSLAYGNGLFIASGPSGTFQSNDGDTWNLTTGGAGGQLCFGGGTFVAVISTQIYFSSNGVNWAISTNLPVNNVVNDAAFTGSTFYLVGSQSNWESNPLSPTSGQASLLDLHLFAGVNVVGAIGSRYRIDRTASISASNWAPVTTLYLGTSPTLWVDTNILAIGSSFYRAVKLD
jgi:hypothetical protein